MTEALLEERVERLERQLLHARAGIARCAQDSSHESLLVRSNRETRRIRLIDIATITTRPHRANWKSVIVHTTYGEHIVHLERVNQILARHPDSFLLIRAGLIVNPANIRVIRQIRSPRGNFGRVMLLTFGSDDPLMLSWKSSVALRRWLANEEGKS